jgi:hypothetical protein
VAVFFMPNKFRILVLSAFFFLFKKNRDKQGKVPLPLLANMILSGMMISIFVVEQKQQKKKKKHKTNQ